MKKRFHRSLSMFLSFLLVLSMSMSLSASAGDIEPITVFWDYGPGANGALTVYALAYFSNDGHDLTAEEIQEYKPYIVVEDASGKEILKRSLSSCEISFDIAKPGSYTVHLYDLTGSDALMPVTHDGLDYLESVPLKLTAEDWKDVPPADDYFAELTEGGSGFYISQSINGKKVELTLYSLYSTGDVNALIRKYQPELSVAYYDSGSGVEYYISDEADHAFKNGKVTLDYTGHDGMNVSVWVNDENTSLVYRMPEGGHMIGTEMTSLTYGMQPTYERSSFEDVPESAWYYDAVIYAADCGLVDGTGNGRFSPNSPMTYAQAVTLAARIHNLFYDDADIPEASSGPWYQRYVDYAKANGIPCDFNMTANATREDYVHIFYAALDAAEDYEAINSIADGNIPDVSASGRYADEIYTFYRAGILTGSGDKGDFFPQKTISRAEVATIVCRMIDHDYRVEFSL